MNNVTAVEHGRCIRQWRISGRLSVAPAIWLVPLSRTSPFSRIPSRGDNVRESGRNRVQGVYSEASSQTSCLKSTHMHSHGACMRSGFELGLVGKLF